MNLPHNDNRSAALLSKRRTIPARCTGLVAFGRVIASSAALLLLSGCIAYVRPTGDWNEPVDLALDAQSLKGVRIKINCTLSDDDGHFTPQEDSDCMKLRVTIGDLGARILLDDSPPEAQVVPAVLPAAEDQTVAERTKIEKDRQGRAAKRAKLPTEIGDAKAEKPDFNVELRSFPARSDHCGKSILILIFSLGLGPCFEDIDSHADLVVTNTGKGTQIAKPLALRIRRILGAPALYMLLVDWARPVSRREYRRQAGAHLLRYVQNVVYSFAIRAKLESERPRVASQVGFVPKSAGGGP